MAYTSGMLGELPLAVLGVACACFWGWVSYGVVRSICGIPMLREQGAMPTWDTPPRLHAIVPARDEGETIERALASLAGQTYGKLLVTAVDDRSSDGTNAAIARVAKAAGNVRPLRVDALPERWLGKVHALSVGVEGVDARWLLFTDADVRFSDGALTRAVAYAESHQLDLLTAFPEVESAGLLADAAFDVVALMMGPVGRLWKMPNPKSSAVGAAGAFILVRQAAWERTPGFEALRLEVADDFGVAHLIKRAGGRCAIVNGVGLIRLRWYTSFADMVRRTQKNFWAIVGRFSVGRLLAGATALSVLTVAPFALVLTHAPVPRWSAALALAFMLVSSVANGAWLERRIVSALLAPVGMLAIAAMMVRAALIGRRIGGIQWRDTFYSSRDLLEGRVIDF